MAIPTETISKLTRGLNNLNDKDRGFARDLIRSVEQRGFSTEKQTYWLELLAKRSAGEAETKTEAVGDLGQIYKLFDTAKVHLKKPAIVLGYTRGQYTSEMTIYVAGERSSTPGVLQVKDGDTWFGRVHKDGNFEHSRRDPPPSSVTDALMRFALDPAGEAAKHGHLTGKCCFCNRKLTDERSTAVGYGQTCAAHFGLPWGKAAAEGAQLALAMEAAASRKEAAPAPRVSPWASTPIDAMDFCVQPADVRRAMAIESEALDAVIAAGIVTCGLNVESHSRTNIRTGADANTKANFLQYVLSWAYQQADISALAQRLPDEQDGADLGAEEPDPADEAERRAVARAYATF